jgi:hypothetical protein
MLLQWQLAALNQTIKTATEPAFNHVHPYQETKVT